MLSRLRGHTVYVVTKTCYSLVGSVLTWSKVEAIAGGDTLSSIGLKKLDHPGESGIDVPCPSLFLSPLLPVYHEVSCHWLTMLFLPRNAVPPHHESIHSGAKK